jgi:hypothetical protein
MEVTKYKCDRCLKEHSNLDNLIYFSEGSGLLFRDSKGRQISLLCGLHFCDFACLAEHFREHYDCIDDNVFTERTWMGAKQQIMNEVLASADKEKFPPLSEKQMKAADELNDWHCNSEDNS